MKVFNLMEEMFRDAGPGGMLLFSYFFIPAVVTVGLVEWIFNGFISRPVIVMKVNGITKLRLGN